VFSKFSSNRVYFDSPYNPIFSNNPFTGTLNFDNYKNTFVENIPTLLQGKEEQIAPYIMNTY
jgi:hypothetical protein